MGPFVLEGVQHVAAKLYMCMFVIFLLRVVCIQGLLPPAWHRGCWNCVASASVVLLHSQSSSGVSER